MKINACQGGFDLQGSDRDKARIIWNIFLKAFEDAVLDNANALSKAISLKEANRIALESLRDELSGVGYNQLPNSERAIRQAEEEHSKAYQNLQESRAMLTFLRDRFLVGFEIPQKRYMLDDTCPCPSI